MAMRIWSCSAGQIDDLARYGQAYMPIHDGITDYLLY